MSISGSRKTNSKGIGTNASSRTNATIIDPEETLLGNLGLLLLRWLA